MSLKNSSKAIVHIAIDEKFIDAAYEIYEKAFTGENRFIILLEEKEQEVKHLSSDKNYEFVTTSDNFLKEVKSKIGTAEIVIFHFLNEYQSRISLSLPDEIKQVWTVFGYEIYNDPYLVGKKIYGKKTFRKFLLFKYYFKKLFRGVYYLLIKRKRDPLVTIHKAMKRMDYVGILIEEEFEFYQQLGILADRARQLKFTYYPLNIVIDEQQPLISDNNILLGNSATYANNHLEAFDLLKKVGTGNRKIITPLSYGKEKYADEIIKKGKRLFGDNFTPLTQFLPLKEYHSLLQMCGIVVMNHYRQQAVGNVLTLLFMGGKVYLSRKNTLYHYLKRKGCIIFCIEEHLNVKERDVFKELSRDEIKHNKEILKRELSVENLCNELNAKLGTLLIN